MITPTPIFTVAQIQALEERVFQRIDPLALMYRAGSAVYALIRERFPNHDRWQVFCGQGNNAGDGWVIAALAQIAGTSIEVVTVGDASRYSPETSAVRQWALRCGVCECPWRQWQFNQDVTLIVDALLGIGASAPARSPFDAAITAINQHPADVVAVDLPSGLSGDTGDMGGAVVAADLTASLLGHKRGALTGLARQWVGEYHLLPLGCDADVATVDSCCDLLEPPSQLLHQGLPPLSKATHKGQQGQVLVVGGDRGMCGAVCLAAEAALRVGAGKVIVATHEAHHATVVNHCAALMTVAPTAMPLPLHNVDALVIGPGTLGNVFLSQLLQHYRDYTGPVVVDAAAIAQVDPSFWHQAEAVTITPHPGEAAARLGSTVDAVERDRFAAVTQLQQQTGAHVLLKGSGSLLADGSGRIGIVTPGNAGMATAGAGDVLAGMLGGLLAQGLPAGQAMQVAALWHGLAGDAIAERIGARSMTACDLVRGLGAVVP